MVSLCRSPPSSTCVHRIEGNDRLETRCHTEGIDSRPVFLPEFLQPARLALSFSATSIHQSHRATDGQPDQSRLLLIRRGLLFLGQGSETGCSCCRSGPPALFPCVGGQRGGADVCGAETGPAIFLDPGGRSCEAQRSGSNAQKPPSKTKTKRNQGTTVMFSIRN